MLRLVKFYDKHKVLLYIIFAVLVIINGLFIAKVQVNYDMSQYLPDDSITKRSISVLEEDFSYPGMARVMVENVTPMEAMEIKKEILAIDGVSSVLWLDDFADITQPLSFIDQEYLRDYYTDNSALYTVEFGEGDYSDLTDQALLSINDLIGDDGTISGSAEDSRITREIMASEVAKILMLVLPFCILILMLAGRSWVEPFLYVISIGVAVVLNMGTNIIFNNVSYITQSMTAVLQLAISMDYSLFLFHRYLEELDNGHERREALALAIRASFSSISASALTTVAGFLALVFMSYSIGFDLGIVLAKGIVFSFITTLTFLPLLILSCHKLIDKTRHRSFLPKFSGAFAGKWKYGIVILAVVIAVPCFFAQQNNDFLYGDTSGSAASPQLQAAKEDMVDTFGNSEPVMILVPKDDVSAEDKMCRELESLDIVRSIQSRTTLADPAIPENILPDSLKDQFLSDEYSRIVVFLNLGVESDLTYESTEELENVAEKYFTGQWYMAGKSTATTDIKITIEQDTIVITLFSLLAVALIILVTFRSLSLPILLVGVIEMSIWINMAVPYFQGTELIFIGYLVVSSIQLGATIDYAILMTNRYLEFRTLLSPNEAARETLKTAGGSVITSATILT
ncbi:MAG: MMPL family transporter, partial [Bacillota bacterium]|nr:MMPL family transporter [Bacillota bacterium]